MLVRDEGAHALLVTQPAHAWLSGQLARDWGNDRFGLVTPYDDVCAGAALHDIGWVRWEDAPTLNPRTGLPHSFLELPVRERMAIWEPASRLAAPFGRYAALLVSLHGTGLYEQFGVGRDASDEDAAAYAAMVEREYAYQERLRASLAADPSYPEHLTAEAIHRNRRLIATLDGVSLAICGGAGTQRFLRSVPMIDDEVDLTLTPDDGDYTVDPWPFGPEMVEVSYEYRRLEGRFTDEGELRSALASAPVRRQLVTLRPA